MGQDTAQERNHTPIARPSLIRVLINETMQVIRIDNSIGMITEV